MVEEEAAEVVAAEAAAEIEEETAVVSPAPADRRLGVRHRPNPGTQGPSIRTCQPGSGPGARCTSAGGKVLSSVRNPPHVRGRIFMLQNLPNKIEKLTSSALKLTLNKYMKICIKIKSIQKYRMVFV